VAGIGELQGRLENPLAGEWTTSFSSHA
jgi:hypothetical protein